MGAFEHKDFSNGRGYTLAEIQRGHVYLGKGLFHLSFCALSEPEVYFPLIGKATLAFSIFYAATYALTALLLLPFKALARTFEGILWSFRQLIPGSDQVELDEKVPDEGIQPDYGLFAKFGAMLNKVKRLFLWTIVGESPLLGYHVMRWLNSDPIDQLFGKLVQARIDWHLTKAIKYGVEEPAEAKKVAKSRPEDSATKLSQDKSDTKENEGSGLKSTLRNRFAKLRGSKKGDSRSSDTSSSSENEEAKKDSQDPSKSSDASVQSESTSKNDSATQTGGYSNKKKDKLGGLKAYAVRVKDRIAFMLVIFFASQIPVIGEYIPLILPFYYMRKIVGKQRAVVTNIALVAGFVGFLYLYIIEHKIRVYFDPDFGDEDSVAMDNLFHSTVGKVNSLKTVLLLTSSFLLDLIQFLDTQVYFSHEIFQAFRNYVNILKAREKALEKRRSSHTKSKKEKSESSPDDNEQSRGLFKLGFSGHDDQGSGSSSEGEHPEDIPDWTAKQKVGPALQFDSVKPARAWYRSHQGVFFGFTWPIYLVIEILFSPYFLPIWRALILSGAMDPTAATVPEPLSIKMVNYPLQTRVMKAFEAFLAQDYADPWATFWWGVVWHLARVGDFLLRWTVWPFWSLAGVDWGHMEYAAEGVSELTWTVWFKQLLMPWLLSTWAVESLKLLLFLLAQMATVPLVVDEALNQEWLKRRAMKKRSMQGEPKQKESKED